ncbi:MAG: hypothetical protein LUB59_02095 [Candidatus Gastranaerophilales bacterium]|nr:hypothetical protein [Candidatus Gastranaerophilales bacterium]
MKDQILKLCRRLKSCTLSDLTQFLEVEESIVETIILYLEQEQLIQITNGVITLAEIKKSKNDIGNKSLYLMFQHRTSEEVDIILKGFCLEISPQKLCHLVNVQHQCISDYYCLFRKNIYERQFKELMHLFFENPQIGRYRKFYEKYAYFYVYNNQIFVSEKLLRANLEKNYTKEEIREFKRMYCYLSRIESHNMNENYMHYRLAEYIWRRERSFEELYDDLRNNLTA